MLNEGREERRNAAYGILPYGNRWLPIPNPSSNFLANMAKSLLNILTQSLHAHKFRSDFMFSYKPALFPVNGTTIRPVGPTGNLRWPHLPHVPEPPVYTYIEFTTYLSLKPMHSSPFPLPQPMRSPSGHRISPAIPKS